MDPHGWQPLDVAHSHYTSRHHMPQLPQGNSLNQFCSKYLSKWNESFKYVRAYNFCYVKAKLSIVSEHKGQSIVTVLRRGILVRLVMHLFWGEKYKDLLFYTLFYIFILYLYSS